MDLCSSSHVVQCSTVYLGFGTHCGFRHPQGALGMYPPWIRGDYDTELHKGRVSSVLQTGKK